MTISYLFWHISQLNELKNTNCHVEFMVCRDFQIILIICHYCQWIGLINTLVGDRFNKNHQIHIFNSHTLFQLSYSATLKSRVYFTTGHLPDHICFFVTMPALSCSRIHLSHSFSLLPWNISNTQITPHHSYTLTLATLILPYKRHVFSLIYGNHYHNYDRHWQTEKNDKILCEYVQLNCVSNL